MKREILDENELARRLAGETIVVLNKHVEKGRIVAETVDETDHGPSMRRMTCYMMHPSTYRRVGNHTWNLWGVKARDILPAPGFTNGLGGHMVPLLLDHSSIGDETYAPNSPAIIEWVIKP